MTLRRKRLQPVIAALLLAAFAAPSLLPAQTAPQAAQPSEPAAEPAVIAVTKRMPAVVNINTERVVKRTVRDPYDAFYEQFFGGAIRAPRTYRQKVQSLGSGFIVDPSGYIVTNEHVVERAADLKISVTTNDGRTFNAKYVTGDPATDLAFIKIESPEPLPYIEPGELSPNLLGQTVLVLGNPLGYGSSVARGILSAKGRSVSVNDTDYKDLLQTDAAINPGNSGGPLIDISGRLVGVASVKMAYTPQGVPTQGIAFAISGETVRERVEMFKKTAAGQNAPHRPGELTRVRKWFGLHVQDLTPDLAESFGVREDAGLLVADVDDNSPAAAAGMKRGLVIRQVGRYQVASSQQLEELLEPVSAGSVVDFTVGVVRRVRGQNRHQLETVTLTAR